MKKLRTLALVLALIFAFTCISQLSHAAKAVPAGKQAKKPVGSKKNVKTPAKKAKAAKELKKKPMAAKESKKKPMAAKKKLITEGGIGAWLSNGHIKFSVFRTEIAGATPSGEIAESGTKWYLVFVEIKNIEKFACVYGGDYHKVMLLDSGLRYYKEQSARKTANWTEAGDKTELTPGGSFKTLYVFKIPNNSIPIKIIFDSSPEDKYPLLKVKL